MGTENIILDIVNVLSLQSCPFCSFDELQGVDVISAFLKLIKKQDIASTLDAVTATIESLFNEYFSCGNIITVNDAVKGDRVQLCMLYILLIYICLLNDNDLRRKIVHASLKLSTEIKLKHLIECIQNRSSGQIKGQSLNRTYLEILVTEDLDFLIEGTSTPKNEAHASRVYTTTPELKRHHSPLKEFLQSPTFRSQRQLREKENQIRNLRLQVNKLEDDIREVMDGRDTLKRKLHSTEYEKQKTTNDNLNLRKLVDEMQGTSAMGETRMSKTVQHQQKLIKDLEAENKTLLDENNKFLEENEDLTQKISKAGAEKLLLSDENMRLSELTNSLKQSCRTVEQLSSELKEKEKLLEDYKQCFQEYCNNKALNKTIEESFDGRLSMGPDISTRLSKDGSMFSADGENMADAVVDKMLIEKNMQVEELKREKQQLSLQLDEMTRQLEINETKHNEIAFEKGNLMKELNTIIELRKNDQQALVQQTESNDNLQNKIFQLEIDFDGKTEELSRLLRKQETLAADLHTSDANRLIANDKLVSLQTDYQSMEVRLVDTEKENKSKQQTIEQLMAKNISVLTELRTVAEGKQESENCLLQLNERNDALVKQMELMKNDESQTHIRFNSIKEEMQLQTQRLQNDLEQASGSIRSLQNEVKLITEKAVSMENANSELQSQCEEFRTSNSNVSAELNLLTEECSVGRLNMIAAEKEIDSLKSKIHQADSESRAKDNLIEEHRTEQASLVEQLASITKSRNESETCLLKRNEEYNTLAEKFKLSENLAAELSAYSEEIKMAKESLERRVEFLDGDLKLRLDEVSESGNANKLLSDKMQHIVQQLDQKETSIKELRDERISLDDEISVLKGSLQAEMHKYSLLKDEHDVVCQNSTILESQNAEFISQTEELKEMRAILTSKVENFGVDKDMSQVKISTLEKKVLSLTKQVNEAEIECTAKNDQIKEFKIEKTSLSQQLASITSSRNDIANALTQLKEDSDQRIDLLTSELKCLEKLKSESDAQCVQFKNEKDILKNQIECFGEELKRSAEQINAFKAENLHLTEKIKSVENMKSCLESQFEESKRNEDTLLKQIECFGKDQKLSAESIKVLTADKLRLIEKIELAELDGKTSFDQLMALRTENESLVQSLASMTDSRNDSSNSFSKLKEEHDAIMLKMGEKDVQLKGNDDQIGDLRSQIKSLSQKLLSTSDSRNEKECGLSRLQKEYDVLSIKARELTEDNIKYKADIITLKNNNSATTDELLSSRGQYAEKDAELKQTSKDLVMLSNKVTSMEVELNRKNDQIRDLTARSNSLSKQVSSLTEVRDEKATALVEVEKRYDDLLVKLKETAKRESSYITQCEEFITIKENLQVELTQVQNDLTLESQQVNSLTNDKNLLTEQVKDMLEENTKVKEETQILQNKHLTMTDELTSVRSSCVQKETELLQITEELRSSCNKISSLQTSLDDAAEKYDNLLKDKLELVADHEKLAKNVNSLESKLILVETELQNSVKKAWALENTKTESLVRCEDLISEKNSLIEEFDKLKVEKVASREKMDSLETEIQKLTEKIHLNQNQNLEQRRKYEKALEENRGFLGQIITLKDEKDKLRCDLNSMRDENHLVSNKNTSLETELVRMSQEKDIIQKKLDEHIKETEHMENMFKTDSELIPTLRTEISNLKTELDNNNQEISAMKAGSVDKQKEVLLTKEDSMRVERELQKTVDSLKGQLKSSRSEATKEKNNLEKMKTYYRLENEKIMTQCKEYEQDYENAQILADKYEKSKKKVSQLTTELASLSKYKLENSTIEKKLAKMECTLADRAASEKKLLTTVQQLRDERQPVMSKLAETEARLKRLATEKNSLTVQLQSSENLIQSMKRDFSRYSITSVGTEWDDSQTPLIPEKESKSKKFTMEAPTAPRTRSKTFSKSSSNALKEKPAPMTAKSSSESNLKTPTAATGSMAPPSTFFRNKMQLRDSIPRNMMTSFRCEDEGDSEFCNDFHLSNLKRGTTGDSSPPLDWRRLSELQRRNSICPPHLRSAYQLETQFNSIPNYSEDRFRSGQDASQPPFVNLTEATERLCLESPHGYNLRKRKSIDDWSPSDSPSNTGDGKCKRLTRSYSRPGPPTPGKPSTSRRQDLNVSQLSAGSATSRESKASAYTLRTPRLRTPRNLVTPIKVKSPNTLALRSASSSNKKGRTPNSIFRILRRGKSPWRKLSEADSPGKVIKPRRIITRIKQGFKQN